MIIAQGLEAGGHRGMFLSQDVTLQAGTFSLLPNIIRSVSLPVIAAGGISDNATAQAAFAMGASAVQVGTAFLLADECDTKDFHRKALQSERAEHTALTNVFSGGLARGIVNRFMQEAGYISESAPPFPHASFVSNPLKAKAESMGSDEFSSLWAGQNARLAKSGTADKIIQDLLGY
jgi:nitronate monooxygenase